MLIKRSRNFLSFFHNWIYSFAQSSQLYGLSLIGRTQEINHSPLIDSWPGNLEIGQKLVQGIFSVRNDSFSFKTGTLFLTHSHACPKEYLFFFHSFEWLRDLRMVSTNISRKRTRESIKAWIKSNNSWTSKPWLLSSWDHEIIGQRLRYWLSMYDFFGVNANEDFKKIFFKSVNCQYRYLKRTYKKKIYEPWKYFQVLIGLIFAVCFLDKKSALLKQYLKELEHNLIENLFQDGGHMSRVPTMHFLVLRDLIDIRSLMRASALEEPLFLQQAIQHIAPLVRFFRHTNGELGNFRGVVDETDFNNISHYKISAAMVDMALSLSDIKSQGISKCIDTGYEKFVSKSGLIILNVKPSLPKIGLAEKDLGVLDFEWSVSGFGQICSSDIILQDGQHQAIRMKEFLNNTETEAVSTVDILRQQKKGHHHIWAKLTHENFLYKLKLQREFCLSPEMGDFRGIEHIIFDSFDNPAIVGTRFIFNKGAEILSDSQRNIRIKVNVLGDKKLNPQSLNVWRLSSSGNEQFLTHSLSDGRLVVALMSLIQPQLSTVIKWAFRLESCNKII